MKRIILCADGTWNEPDQLDKTTGRRRPTNVTKLARAISPRSSAGIDQVVFYHGGVGTNGGLDKFTGGAFGRGIEANIRDLYRFIVFNYEPGDEIYLFGFSRGAFTVRTLVGFMNKFGLIQKDDDYYVPDIYACYENNAQPGSDEWNQAFHNIKDGRPCPPIRMIGVWDTVGALGVPGLLGHFFNKDKYKYHDVTLHSCVENAYHALAVDERRKPFAPDLWTRPSGWTGKLEQVWFGGVHSNVGGGYTPDGLANEALHWLAEKAEGLGVEFDSAFLSFFEPHYDSILQNSMTMIYRLMGPFIRPVGQHLQDGEAVHQAVLDRLRDPKCDYKPETAAALQKLPVVQTKRVDRRAASA
jgi:uncharacterized protein (DUF2235 family)